MNFIHCSIIVWNRSIVQLRTPTSMKHTCVALTVMIPGALIAQVPPSTWGPIVGVDSIHCIAAGFQLQEDTQHYLYQEEDLSNDTDNDYFYMLRIYDQDTLPLAVMHIKMISHVSQYALGETGLVVDGEPARLENMDPTGTGSDDFTLDRSLYFESWLAGIQVEVNIAEAFVENFCGMFHFSVREEDR